MSILQENGCFGSEDSNYYYWFKRVYDEFKSTPNYPQEGCEFWMETFEQSLDDENRLFPTEMVFNPGFRAAVGSDCSQYEKPWANYGSYVRWCVVHDVTRLARYGSWEACAERHRSDPNYDTDIRDLFGEESWRQGELVQEITPLMIRYQALITGRYHERPSVSDSDESEDEEPGLVLLSDAHVSRADGTNRQEEQDVLREIEDDWDEDGDRGEDNVREPEESDEEFSVNSVVDVLKSKLLEGPPGVDYEGRPMRQQPEMGWSDHWWNNRFKGSHPAKDVPKDWKFPTRWEENPHFVSKESWEREVEELAMEVGEQQTSEYFRGKVPVKKNTAALLAYGNAGRSATPGSRLVTSMAILSALMIAMPARSVGANLLLPPYDGPADFIVPPYGAITKHNSSIVIKPSVSETISYEYFHIQNLSSHYRMKRFAVAEWLFLSAFTKLVTRNDSSNGTFMAPLIAAKDDIVEIVHTIEHPVDHLMRTKAGHVILALAGLGILMAVLSILIYVVWPALRVLCRAGWMIKFCASAPFRPLWRLCQRMKLKWDLRYTKVDEEIKLTTSTTSNVCSDEGGLFLRDGHRKIYFGPQDKTVAQMSYLHPVTIGMGEKEAIMPGGKFWSTDKFPKFQGEILAEGTHVGWFSRIEYKGLPCVLTAAHVIEFNRQLNLSLKRGEVTIPFRLADLNIESYSPVDQLDYVICSTTEAVFSLLQISKGTMATKVGQESVGFVYQTVKTGEEVKQAYSTGKTVKMEAPFLVKHTCSTMKGASGAPLLNLRHEIIGVHLETREGANFASIPPCLWRHKETDYYKDMDPRDEDESDTDWDDIDNEKDWNAKLERMRKRANERIKAGKGPSYMYVNNKNGDRIPITSLAHQDNQTYYIGYGTEEGRVKEAPWVCKKCHASNEKMAIKCAACGELYKAEKPIETVGRNLDEFKKEVDDKFNAILEKIALVAEASSSQKVAFANSVKKAQTAQKGVPLADYVKAVVKENETVKANPKQTPKVKIQPEKAEEPGVEKVSRNARRRKNLKKSPVVKESATVPLN